MSRLFYIQASPRGTRSHSIAVADAFVEAYLHQNPGDQVDRLNVFQADLPVFDGATVDAKYAILHGVEHSAEQRQAWTNIEAVIERFTSADKYVLAIPMWNFGIPYRLKQYVDILVQPGYTFSYSPDQGYKGLVTEKPAFIAYASGGAYAPGTDFEAYDMQKPYVEGILAFIGFTDISSIAVEPTLMAGPDVSKEKQAAAIEQAVKMAKTF